MKPEDVTAVLVTRGDCDLSPIRATLTGFREIVVWDNSGTPAPARRLPSDLLAAVQLRQSTDFLRQFDLKVFGRYAAATEAYADFLGRPDCTAADVAAPFAIYVQDDDCKTEPERIVAEFEPGVVTCNMPEAFRPSYTDGIALVGFGAVFDVRLIAEPFNRYLTTWPRDALFLVECDRIFTKLNKLRFVDVPVERFPESWNPGKLWRRVNHAADLEEVRRRLEELTA